MPATKAHIKASNKYNTKAYDRIAFLVRKDGDITRDVIKDLAESAGESVNAYILEAIRRRIEQGN